MEEDFDSFYSRMSWINKVYYLKYLIELGYVVYQENDKYYCIRKEREYEHTLNLYKTF